MLTKFRKTKGEADITIDLTQANPVVTVDVPEMEVDFSPEEYERAERAIQSMNVADFMGKPLEEITREGVHILRGPTLTWAAR